MQNDIKYFASFSKQLVEIDLRQLLKKQSTIRHHQEWVSQRRTKRAIKDVEDVEWRSTLRLVHNERSVHTFFSSVKDTRQRTHHIKKLHGALPTMNVMHARRPDLYPDSICCVCNFKREDNDHLWECRDTLETRGGIWKDALERINGWGVRAVSKYNKKSKEKYEKEVAKGKAVEPAKQIVWRNPSIQRHARGMACIDGARMMLLGSEEAEQTESSNWNIKDLYRGITPLSLIENWTPIFGIPLSIAREVIHKFVGFLESEATERIWKPRCNATVEYERSRGITARSKKGKCQGARGLWTDGYGFICEEGFCHCGSPLEEHDDDGCPGEKNDPKEADCKLISSLVGKRRLRMMEGMGRIPFV
jgi:hypothetical protein